MRQLKYAVVGSGAVGGFYGGKLAQSGQEVHFLFHKNYEYVSKHGLYIDSVDGDIHLQQIHAYHSTEDMPACDVIIVALKTTTNQQVLPQLLKPMVHEGTCILLIQNGLCMESDLAVSFPEQSIMGAMAFICSNKVGPGQIKHLDYGALTIANYQKTPADILQQIAADFQAAQVPVTIADDLNTARWKKLVWNIPYNGLTVVLHSQTDQLMNQPETRKLIYDLMIEVIEAANACGAPIPISFAEKMLASTDQMKPYSPSMLLDYENLRPMEIEYLYERPIQQAALHGFLMKKTEVIQQQLRFTEQQKISIP